MFSGAREGCAGNKWLRELNKFFPLCFLITSGGIEVNSLKFAQYYKRNLMATPKDEKTSS